MAEISCSNTKNNAVGLSPYPYSLLEREKEALGRQGMRTTRRELADRAIIATYGRQGEDV